MAASGREAGVGGGDGVWRADMQPFGAHHAAMQAALADQPVEDEVQRPLAAGAPAKSSGFITATPA